MAFGRQDPIDEELNELETGIKRLRVDYDQYFLGIRRQPPEVLRGRVQKTITRLANDPPRNTGQKFRFNQLNSQFQIFRQMWGRTLREIENGSYRAHRFKADLHDRERLARERAEIDAEAAGARPAGGARRTGIDGLYDALMAARQKTGGAGPAPDRAKLAEMVKKQTAAIRAKHPDAKIKFKVSVENGKPKVKATVSRA